LIAAEAKAPTIEQLLQNATDNGVAHMLCVCVDLDDADPILQLARRWPQVYATAGVHPNTECREEASEQQLCELAASPDVIAIGETGLDYFRSGGEQLAIQHQRFRTHIRAARILNKPLVVHTRDAKEDVIRLLREEHAEECGGVMHCFVEDWDTAEQALDLGFYISFSGIVTFKNAQPIREVARRVPLDRLLVETDSPYLAPVPFRGKTNQPAYVRYVAEKIAEIREIDVSELATITTDNFFRLFNA
jgi:TatD DNase family protein